MFARLLAPLLVVPLLYGCGHVSVSDSRKTSNPAFDGQWEGKISGTKEEQKLPRYNLTCGKVLMNLVAEIENGRMKAQVPRSNLKFETNINDAGKFYFAIPREERGYRTKLGSDYQLPSDEFYVFRGQLNPETQSGTGRYVHARRDMGMEGCRTPIVFTRKDNAV